MGAYACGKTRESAIATVSSNHNSTISPNISIRDKATSV
jgi:hypothetical protein